MQIQWIIISLLASAFALPTPQIEVSACFMLGVTMLPRLIVILQNGAGDVLSGTAGGANSAIGGGGNKLAESGGNSVADLSSSAGNVIDRSQRMA